jgi:PAS domain S-box-containing protein
LNPGALVQNAKEMPAVEEAQWEAGDTLLSPLMNAAGEPLGLISVDAPRDGRQPDDLAVETLEIFSNEAALLIESSQKLGQLQRDFKQVQAQVARAEETSAAAESHLSTMLHKDLEQTIAIQRLSERARRIRIGLDIAEIANQQPDRSSVLTSLGHQMLTQMHLDTALIAEQTASGPRLLHSLGAVPDAGRPEALLGQRNPLQHTLQSGEMLLVANIDETPDWQNTPLLASLNAKSFIALPIASNGAVEAAVLAVSNTASAPFTDEDRQIYELIGNQAAIALQNLELLTETQRRLREVNLLLEFSQQLGSLDPTEILRTLVQSSLRVMTNAHAGFVALWSEQQNKLVVAAAGGYTENSLITEIAYAKGEALPGQVFASGAALRVAEVDFARQYNLSPEQLLKYREATGGRVPVSSMLIPIQAGGETLGVINLDNFNTSAAFSQDDEALVSSLTQQTALTLENARLFQASEQRAKQLQSLTDVATTITSSLETNALIVSLLDQLAPILPFDTGTLWLREGERLTIKAASGFEDSEQRMGLSVAMEDSVLLKGMIETGEPIAVPNTHEDDRFPALSEHRYHSWLGMPLITKGEVVGVIALEKAEEDFYSLEDVQATKTFAGQAAVALENARLFEESLNRAHDLDERSQRLAQLNRVSTELSSSLDSDHLLAYTAEELSQATNASAVSVILFQEEGASLRFETPGDSSVSLPALLPDTPLFERMREMQGTVTSEDVLDDERFSGLLDLLARRQTKSMLALPLASGDKTDGLFLIHKDERHRFTPGEIELALTISNQAAVALQNARLFDETRRFTAELEQRVAERTEELAREGQFTRTALQISTELSSSLDLDQVLNRSLRRLNETTGAHQSSIILRRPGEENLYYRAGVGITESPPTGGRPSTIKASEGLAGWVIEHREQLVVPNLFEDERWLIGQPDHTLHKSAIGAPLIVGEDALGALLLYYGEEGHFSSDQLNLLQAAANQFAVAINNGELFQLIRDQAEDLGTMLRAQQVEASRSTAMLAGVADGVLVTDDSGAISLFNESAETILGLDSDQVVGKSIDEFTGLFGRAARSWMEAIQQWSHDPPSAKANESFSDQITLEDGKVVSVRLSPVSVRDEFLGTVSIFQDVTHEVEVDKLKSEFVATVSHELRTPMTPIKGYVDFLLMGGAGDLNEQQMNFMEIIKSNTDRLGILVNDLLDISRIEAGQVGLTFQLLDLREFAEEIVATTLRRAQVEGKPMNIELAAEKDVPLVEGDPERIRQIMSNLIDNAFNYTQEHGNIKVLIYKTRGEVQVEVEDSGIGIAPEEQEKVFERFYRGENPLVMATAGTGLGLPIVKQLVEMHKGKIWLESTGKSGEGSKFSFTLPAPKTEEQSNDE